MRQPELEAEDLETLRHRLVPIHQQTQLTILTVAFRVKNLVNNPRCDRELPSFKASEFFFDFCYLCSYSLR